MLLLMSTPGEVTIILDEIRAGRREGFERLIPLVYRELRHLAYAHMKRESDVHTLQPTALVHEVFLRLMAGMEARWQDREHFFASASAVMRNLLVDHARARGRLKRGGGTAKVSVDEAIVLMGTDPTVILDLHDALDRFARLDPRAARVVEMRCFLGLDHHEIAAAMDVSARTVKRDWRVAKAWLQAELRDFSGSDR